MFVLGASAGGSQFLFPILLVAMFAVMYFTMIRPQKKQQQKRQEMMKEMVKGDEIITIGGLHGTIDSINETLVVLDCSGVFLTFNRNAIREVTKHANDTVEETVQSTTVDESTDSKDDAKDDSETK